MTQTAYQLCNEDGTSDRFIIQSFPVGFANKIIRNNVFECASGTWIPIKKLSEATIAHRRATEDTEMLFHSLARRHLMKRYRARIEFDATRSTIFK